MTRVSRCFARVRIGVVVLASSIGASGLSLAASVDEARQQADIAALIQELDYLIDHTERLADRYRADRAPVTFNYASLAGAVAADARAQRRLSQRAPSRRPRRAARAGGRVPDAAALTLAG